MKNWFILTFAVCCEGVGSIALKQAQHDKVWFILTLLSDAIAFALLALLLRRGMGLSVVYGIWGAMGVALTALLGTVLFHEPFTGVMGLGIAFVVAGVLLVEAGSDHSDHSEPSSGLASSAAPGLSTPQDSSPSEPVSGGLSTGRSPESADPTGTGAAS